MRGARAPVWIATVLGVGQLPVAPGTFGSLVGLALFLGFSHLGVALYAISVLALTALGVWASGIAEHHFGRKDDGRIVIDEVVGQLWLLAPLVVLAPLDFLGLRSSDSGIAGFSSWCLLLVTGFVLFRVLDIAKPGPVGWAERRFEGGMGVMADDVVAGAVGALLLTPVAYAAVIARLASDAGVGAREL
ncbi:MAG: phosphatidylglycerophosphatase A, partial [Myxococcota bacterium]|nr:phosphatidylglycerophosphatase A [Myxococcota bacterium]